MEGITERARLVGANIKRFRQLAGLTKSDLARLVKVSPTAVHNWEENGTMPRAEVMYDLGKALEVDFVHLMGLGAKKGAASPDCDDPSSQSEMSRGERLAQFRRQIAALFEVAPENVDIIIRT